MFLNVSPFYHIFQGSPGQPGLPGPVGPVGPAGLLGTKGNKGEPAEGGEGIKGQKVSVYGFSCLRSLAVSLAPFTRNTKDVKREQKLIRYHWETQQYKVA